VTFNKIQALCDYRGTKLEATVPSSIVFFSLPLSHQPCWTICTIKSRGRVSKILTQWNHSYSSQTISVKYIILVTFKPSTDLI